MPPNSRQKGARGEREAAKVWSYLFPHLDSKRGQQRSGLEQADVVDVCDDFHIEVKRYQKFAIWKFILQIRRDKKENQIGVLQYRPDGDTDWQVSVSMKDLIPFARKIVELADGN